MQENSASLHHEILSNDLNNNDSEFGEDAAEVEERLNVSNGFSENSMSATYHQYQPKKEQVSVDWPQIVIPDKSNLKMLDKRKSGEGNSFTFNVCKVAYFYFSANFVRKCQHLEKKTNLQSKREKIAKFGKLKLNKQMILVTIYTRDGFRVESAKQGLMCS